MKRKVFLHVESEHLKGEKELLSDSRFRAMEVEVKWLVQMVEEASHELLIYETADNEMYKINENTKARVFNYSGFSFLILIGLAIWEVYYLHSFFKAKV
jgi:p24 family protein delta-1